MRMIKFFCVILSLFFVLFHQPVEAKSKGCRARIDGLTKNSGLGKKKQTEAAQRTIAAFDTARRTLGKWIKKRNRALSAIRGRLADGEPLTIWEERLLRKIYKKVKKKAGEELSPAQVLDAVAEGLGVERKSLRRAVRSNLLFASTRRVFSLPIVKYPSIAASAGAIAGGALYASGESPEFNQAVDRGAHSAWAAVVDHAPEARQWVSNQGEDLANFVEAKVEANQDINPLSGDNGQWLWDSD